jgi:hypothetical protein
VIEMGCNRSFPANCVVHQATLGFLVLTQQKFELALEIAEQGVSYRKRAISSWIACGSVRPVKIPVRLSSTAIASPLKSPHIERAALTFERTGLAVNQCTLRNGIVRVSRVPEIFLILILSQSNSAQMGQKSRRQA